ncbi:MAG: cytochrome c oxidase subunit II [Opitutaceae bacterium]|nr:cytochrome c oxidase subunit II [Opitutaceae bacterium]
MLTYFIENASSYGQDIDSLFSLVTVLAGFWFILAELVLFYFIFRFRRKKDKPAQYITGEKKKEMKWIKIPHHLILVCDVFIVIGAIYVWIEVKQDSPPIDEEIRIIGQQWAWSFVQPGPDGLLDTDDDISTVDTLHIKVNTVYRFHLESEDVMHSFSVPVFRLKQDAVPGRIITGWFEAIKEGEFDIQCTEMCGIGHGVMAARIIIESEEKHNEWMTASTSKASSTEMLADTTSKKNKTRQKQNG